MLCFSVFSSKSFQNFVFDWKWVFKDKWTDWLYVFSIINESRFRSLVFDVEKHLTMVSVPIFILELGFIFLYFISIKIVFVYISVIYNWILYFSFIFNTFWIILGVHFIRPYFTFIVFTLLQFTFLPFTFLAIYVSCNLLSNLSYFSKFKFQSFTFPCNLLLDVITFYFFTCFLSGIIR